MQQRAEGAADGAPSRHGQRSALGLDVVVRVGVVAFVLQWWFGRGADAPTGIGLLLVVYAIWNIAFLAVELLVMTVIDERDSVSFLAVGAVPRLVWLIPFAIQDFGTTPWLMPLVVLTVVVVALACYPALSRIPALVHGVGADTLLR